MYYIEKHLEETNIHSFNNSNIKIFLKEKNCLIIYEFLHIKQNSNTVNLKIETNKISKSHDNLINSTISKSNIDNILSTFISNTTKRTIKQHN